MTPEMWDRLRPFRDEASARDIPADDVERRLDTARPCVTLTRAEDGEWQEAGPVVGRFGGPLLLPPDVPDPARPFVASIDLTALRTDTTDLPLPPDGHLLLFAFPETADDYETRGSAVHVPAGTAVTERDPNAWNTFDFEDEEAMFKAFPQGPLRATAGVSLPYHHAVEYPRAGELVQVWNSTQDAITPQAPIQLGGYAWEEAVHTDPVAIAAYRAGKAAEAGHWPGPVSPDASDWLLLADWQAGMDVEGWESASVHWAIQREDLATGRFDRAFTSVFWNP
ncbi:DUF1963 domain-containing protein [Streptomyces hokutonensis]|uniref:DUF1963 domain-containing protein n=1 Tax=Streptomyces hokutonensis TaxID=1306990 RepID=UPI003682F1C5